MSMHVDMTPSVHLGSLILYPIPLYTRLSSPMELARTCRGAAIPTRGVISLATDAKLHPNARYTWGADRW